MPHKQTNTLPEIHTSAHRTFTHYLQAALAQLEDAETVKAEAQEHAAWLQGQLISGEARLHSALVSRPALYLWAACLTG